MIFIYANIADAICRAGLIDAENTVNHHLSADVNAMTEALGKCIGASVSEIAAEALSEGCIAALERWYRPAAKTQVETSLSPASAGI